MARRILLAWGLVAGLAIVTSPVSAQEASELRTRISEYQRGIGALSRRIEDFRRAGFAPSFDHQHLLDEARLTGDAALAVLRGQEARAAQDVSASQERMQAAVETLRALAALDQEPGSPVDPNGSSGYDYTEATGRLQHRPSAGRHDGERRDPGDSHRSCKGARRP